MESETELNKNFSSAKQEIDISSAEVKLALEKIQRRMSPVELLEYVGFYTYDRDILKRWKNE